jgi:hypothetical protein
MGRGLQWLLWMGSCGLCCHQVLFTSLSQAFHACTPSVLALIIPLPLWVCGAAKPNILSIHPTQDGLRGQYLSAGHARRCVPAHASGVCMLFGVAEKHTYPLNGVHLLHALLARIAGHASRKASSSQRGSPVARIACAREHTHAGACQSFAVGCMVVSTKSKQPYTPPG